MLRRLAGFTLLLVSVTCAQDDVRGQTAAVAFVRSQAPPAFRDGHALPPLSQWRAVSHELAKELADHWGYALYLGRLTPELVKSLDAPDSSPGRIVRLAAARPDKYKLQVTIAPAFSIRGYLNELPPDSFVRDADGGLARGKRIFSPTAPAAAYATIGRFEAQLIAAVQKYAPVAIITNGGEYGHNAFGHNGDIYAADPQIAAARGDRPWPQFLADHKARLEAIVSAEVRKAAPDALYIMYAAGAGGNTHRHKYDGWDNWGSLYRPAVSMLPAPSLYYAHYNTGFVGNDDLLTQFLNARAQELAAGCPYGYPWVSLGWRRSHTIGDATLYTGWLKCVYTAGALGAAAGYFGASPEDDPADESLPQFLALGRVHAVFSFLDEFLRNSDLLPGPNPHVWSKDLPAYEFPTGAKDKRVVVRKHKRHDAWLLCAWAADGTAAEVAVDIPAIGKVSVAAPPDAALYRLTKTQGAVRVEHLDKPAEP